MTGSWLARLFARRTSPSWTTSQSADDFRAVFGSVTTSAAGVAVTPERALTVPSVYACVNVLSQDVAKTPIKMRRRVGPDSFADAVDHDLWEILSALPNPETSAYSLKHQLMFDLLTHERAYAEIVRVDGRVTALWRLDPRRVSVDRDEARRKRWRFTDDRGQAHTWMFDPSRPPIFELAHPSPLRHCRDLIGAALALQVYVGRFFANGARPNGVLKSPHGLDTEQAKALRDQFESLHQGAENQHRIAVLEEGLEYAAIATPNDEAQMNETLQSIRNEIAGVFRVPPFKISDMTRANYSNVEALAIEYVTGSLDPYFTVWEHAIRRDLLTTRQYGQFDVIFDRSTLIRSDIKSLHEALARGRDAGFYSANDVRRKLGENPIPVDQGGDLYLMNANLVPLTDTGTATTENAA